MVYNAAMEFEGVLKRGGLIPRLLVSGRSLLAIGEKEKPYLN
jgi:hypothetical protein